VFKVQEERGTSPGSGGEEAEVNTVEARVKAFLETWKKRESGELPMPDLKVFCSKCGAEIKGDDRVEFTQDGLVCVDCYRRGDGRKSC